MSLFYKLQYLLGITPWERMPSLPIGEQAVALLGKEERGREAPYGRALDLGCGTGLWSVRLAQRGWEVTGVDIVPKAVRIARRRARRAGAGGEP
jgi:methylase of polypeptide subunit release factors